MFRYPGILRVCLGVCVLPRRPTPPEGSRRVLGGLGTPLRECTLLEGTLPQGTLPQGTLPEGTLLECTLPEGALLEGTLLPPGL